MPHQGRPDGSRRYRFLNKMEHLQYTTHTDDEFELTTANEWLVRAKEEPKPEMRYSNDATDKSYPFMHGVHRVELSNTVLRRIAENGAEAELPAVIKKLLAASGARVLIIDNLSYFKRTADGLRELGRLMSELR